MATRVFNRRHFPRQKAKDIITALLIQDAIKTHEEGTGAIPGQMYNQSEEGLYVEVNRALKPGLNVRIKMLSPAACHPEEPYYLRDGRVVWCTEIDQESRRFGVGIKILRKVVQAPVLTSRFGKENFGI